jgi:hypothetical protein
VIKSQKNKGKKIIFHCTNEANRINNPIPGTTETMSEDNKDETKPEGEASEQLTIRVKDQVSS